MTDSKLDKVIETFLEQSHSAKALTVCVGAGASLAAGMPSWAELLEKVAGDTERRTARKAVLPLHSEDMWNSGEWTIQTVGIRRFLSNLREVADRLEPTEIHHALASLPARTFITTNYDSLLEQALVQSGKMAQVVTKDSDLSRVDYRGIPVVKLHGTLEEASSLVLSTVRSSNVAGRTEDALRSYLRATFATSLVLFVGFSVRGSFANLYELYSGPRGISGDWALIDPDVDDPHRSLWSNRGIRFVDIGYDQVPAFLRRLTTHLTQDKQRPRRRRRTRRIFLSIGRKHLTGLQLRHVLTEAGYEPVTLQDSPFYGRSLLERFDEIAVASSAAIVVLESQEPELGFKYSKLPRPNSLLELGYLLAKLGRERVLVVIEEGVDLPSDLAGATFVVADSKNPSAVALAVNKWIEVLQRPLATLKESR